MAGFFKTSPNLKEGSARERSLRKPEARSCARGPNIIDLNRLKKSWFDLEFNATTTRRRPTRWRQRLGLRLMATPASRVTPLPDRGVGATLQAPSLAIVLTRSFSVAAKSCHDGARATFLQYNYIHGCDIEHHTRMMASSYLTRECQSP